MKRAIVLALTTLCAMALIAVPAQAAGGKAKKAQRPGRSGVCVVVVKQPQSRTAPRRGGVRRSPRCRGPRGFRGPAGRAGPRGADGKDGKDGKDGANGSNGSNGANGRDGATGPTGPKGDKGDKGDPGTPAGGGTRYAIVRAAETTASTTFAPLATPGPFVTVEVPASGTIMVTASSISADGDGSVSLFEDGVQVPGQGQYCAGPSGTLFDTLGDFGPPAETYGTPGSIGSFGICGVMGMPSPVVVQATPGVRRFELRYSMAACGCGSGDPATFSDRKLWVTPLP